MSDRKLVVASQFEEAVNRQIAERGNVEVVGIAPGVPSALPAPVDILLARPFFKAGQNVSSAPPLGWADVRWVQISSVGLDNYPAWLFERKLVTSVRGLSAVAIAEFVLTLILTAVKRVPDIWIHAPSEWTSKHHGVVSGTTLGIVGFGAIGQALAVRARALDMEVLAYRRSRQPPEVPGVERVTSLPELFARSDHVVLAAPATRETRHMIDSSILAEAKQGLHLINVARGALIDEQALLGALDKGRLALASLDVTEVEPLPDGHPFYHHPKVRLSPHASPGAPNIERGLLDRFLANLDAFAAGRPLADQVDYGRGY